MSLRADNLQFSAEAKIGFETALQEIEHQAEHPDNRKRINENAQQSRRSKTLDS